MFGFFRNRSKEKVHQSLNGAVLNNSLVLQVGGDINQEAELYHLLNLHRNDAKLLNHLVCEKLDLCQNLILESNYR